MAGALRVATIRGIPIYVHAGWVIVYALITWSLAVGYFPQALPELPAAAHWVNGLIAALLLFVSVLLHELSHAFVALGQGLRVRDITLHVFGGVSHIEEEAIIGGAWMILLGLFLSTAAEMGYAQTTVRRILAKIRVADVMARDVVTVSADATVADLVELFWAHHVTSFPVVEGDTVRGIATVQSVHEVPRERWTQTRVRDVMRRLDEDLAVAPRDTLVRALDKASRNGIGRLAVIEDGRLRGYLSLKDVTHVLTLQGSRAGAAEARPSLRRAA